MRKLDDIADNLHCKLPG